MNIEDPMQQNIRRTGMATMPPLMMKPAMPISPTPTLPRRERGQANRYASFTLTTGPHALKKIRSIMDKENADDEFKALTLRQLGRYGWIVLLLIAAMLARLTGVI